ncbi:MAG: DUF3899 domain-containing protein [Clostridia bacterium]|nr:DUF3899 domain-containing protein [Clostridia bacterium]
MKENSKLRAYLINLAVAAVMAMVGMMAWDLTEQSDAPTVIRILSDCFFLPGVLLVGASLIGWVASKGTFDMFGYTGHNFINMFKRDSYLKHESYYDYKMKKDEKRRPFNIPRTVVGLGFLALGVIFTVIYICIA